VLGQATRRQGRQEEEGRHRQGCLQCQEEEVMGRWFQKEGKERQGRFHHQERIPEDETANCQDEDHHCQHRDEQVQHLRVSLGSQPFTHHPIRSLVRAIVREMRAAGQIKLVGPEHSKMWLYTGTQVKQAEPTKE